MLISTFISYLWQYNIILPSSFMMIFKPEINLQPLYGWSHFSIKIYHIQNSTTTWNREWPSLSINTNIKIVIIIQTVSAFAAYPCKYTLLLCYCPVLKVFVCHTQIILPLFGSNSIVMLYLYHTFAWIDVVNKVELWSLHFFISKHYTNEYTHTQNMTITGYK